MKRLIAGSLGGLLLAAGISIPDTALAAVTPSEVKVVPAPTYPAYPTTTLGFGGETGFLHRRTASTPWLWTTYAERRTTTVAALANVSGSAFTPGGSDTVVLGASVPDHPVTDTTRPALDLATMTWRELTMGKDAALNRLLGDSLLTVRPGTPSTVELQRLAADGSATTIPITGIPESTTGIRIMAGDADGAVLAMANGGSGRYGLLEVVTGQVHLLPGNLGASAVLLTNDRIGLITSLSVRSYSRAEVLADDVTAQRFLTFPASVPYNLIGLAGADVIVTPSSTNENKTVLRYTRDGVDPISVEPRGDTFQAQASDGVIFVGGAGTGDWSVRKATAGGDSVVLPLTAPMANAGVTLTSGVLRHTAALPRLGEAADYRSFAEQIGPGAEGTGSTVADLALLTPVPCETGATCVRMVDGGRKGTAYLSRSGTVSMLRDSNSGTGGIAVPSGVTTLVDAAPYFWLVSGPTQQHVVEDAGSIRLSYPTTGAALWFNTLWRASAAGVLQPISLPLGGAGTPISTGSTCTATEVQATAQHLYWSCGVGGPTGVYDLVRKRNVTLPAGRYLLGDNYVVRHEDGGALVRLDLTDGVLGEPVTLATFPRGELADDRNINWAVDKLGGDVAWVDGDNAVHIVDPGVAATDPTALASNASVEISLPGTFQLNATLSRPVSSTTLTITQVRTGTVVARVTGGAARFTATTIWDGLTDGKRVTRGTYRWALAGTVDGRISEMATGTVAVSCGALPTLHSYECNGQPSLLGLTSASTGRGTWLYSRPGTTALTTGSAETLATLNGLVPFGDINQDFKNDLLVRRSDGTMRAYLGTDSPPLGDKPSLAVPGTWNVYDALVHTGDVTGDGRSDLIARERESGALYLFAGTGTGTGFKTAVKLAGGYKGYSKVIGPGDIDNDGNPDIMLQYDPTSTMYVLYGNDDGTFKSGLGVVGTGWLGYNVVIGAGDLNEDGKNDLILRDTAGKLYRRLGTGSSTFGDRSLIGSGYQQYAGLY